MRCRISSQETGGSEASRSHTAKVEDLRCGEIAFLAASWCHSLRSNVTRADLVDQADTVHSARLRMSTANRWARRPGERAKPAVNPIGPDQRAQAGRPGRHVQVLGHDGIRRDRVR